MLKQIKTIAAASLLLVSTVSKAQLTISSGAVFNIQSGAFVTVQGDVTSNADITGTGNLVLKGAANQNVNMNGFIIPNLEMDNAANATLTGNAKITNSVLFTNGKLIMGNNTATLGVGTTATGMGAGKFFETNGTGFLRREFTADIPTATAATLMPVGAGSDYLPVSLTNTGSTYAGASIGVQAIGTASTNKHVRTESFLMAKWPVDKAGITGGTTNAVGTYVDPTRVIGTETDLRGIYWNGTNWSLTGGNQDAALNTVGATIAANSGELYGMNKFLLFDTKVILQGAYNAGTGLMNDLLRTNVAYAYSPTATSAPASNLLPTSDPYRQVGGEYVSNPNFTRFGNNITETVTGTAFYDQAIPTDNIVDWVFLELRTSLTPGTVIQTRSALLQRDGDVVDVDGVSPIYFKNVDAGSYVISVKHRNHLAMSMNVANYTQTLGLIKNTQFDFSTTAAGNLLGTSGVGNTNYFNGSSKNMLYAGNVNGNANIRYTTLNNDKDALLINVLGGNASTVIGQVGGAYSRGDLNMNRVARFTTLNNDKDYLYITILGSNVSTVKTQVLP
jgi:hypothetical protein